MNNNQVKVIQSRLKNRGKKFTLEQIRTHILIDYHDEDLTEEQMSVIVDKLAGSSELASTGAGALSNTQKETLIQDVAASLDVDLSVEQVKQISQKMDWALRDRASLREKVCEAILAWANYKLDQDEQDTDQMMDKVEELFLGRLKQNNQHFKTRVNNFSQQIDKTLDNFRTTEKEILDLFKVPS